MTVTNLAEKVPQHKASSEQIADAAIQEKKECTSTFTKSSTSSSSAGVIQNSTSPSSAVTTFVCDMCVPPKIFQDGKSLKGHEYSCHSGSFKVEYIDQKGKDRSVEVNVLDSKYACPFCPMLYKTRKGATDHVKNKKGGCGEAHANPDSISDDGYSSDEDLEIGVSVVVDIATSVDKENIDPVKKTADKRTYDDYVLQACGLEFEEPSHKRYALETMEYFKLRPFKMGEGVAGLTNQNCINSAAKLDKTDFEIIPKENSTAPLTGVDNHYRFFNNMICTSPYENVLSKRNYVEIEESTIKELNIDWNFSGRAKYYAAQCLAGSIIVNKSKKQAVISNAIEIYGRTRTIDSHREKFGAEKNSALETSLPRRTSKYEHLSVMIKGDIDGEKLVIGTHSFNALVTSSLRIDKQVPASIGAKVKSFTISYDDEIRVFLDQVSINKANELLQSNQLYLETFDMVYQMRQLKSKFDRKSTYFLIRGINPILNNHTFYPYTTFTVCDYDGGGDTDSKMISCLFKMIASESIKKENPEVKRTTIKELQDKVHSQSSTLLLQQILDLFPTKKSSSINLYHNQALDNILKDLAKSLSSSISTANKTIAINVQSEFLK